MFEREAWEERYRAEPALWSGRPNPQLVVAARSLEPGRALDVGCGEGADAIWLAGRGWEVTAVDISTVALERAVAHSAGTPVTWVHADLRDEPPREKAFDLVSAQDPHPPGESRGAAVAHPAEAGGPGREARH